MQTSPNALSSPSPAVEKIALDVGGMKCAGCVMAVERQLKQYPGVISACVNLATEVASIECEVGRVDPAVLAEKLTKTGFPAQPRSAAGGKVGANSSQSSLTFAERQRQEIRQQIWQVAIALMLVFLSGIGHLNQMGVPTIPALHNLWFHGGLATLALLLPGRGILLDGWRGLWHNAPNMNTLVGLGALSAYLASCVALLFPQLGWECFFDEPVMMLGFILLGRTLEKQARYRATAALGSLLSLQPVTARLVAKTSDSPKDQGAIAATAVSVALEIPADQVRVGEWLQVLPGEKIPVDGDVIAGHTTVDESMLTGEAMPVSKHVGSSVAAGTLNQSGVIVLEATRTGTETTLAQIVALVEEAQTRKAPVQKLADTVAGYFTYGVLAIATVTFGFWYGVGTHIWPDVLMPQGEMASMLGMGHLEAIAVPTSPLLLSLKLAIAVLVIACPCSLGLATPTAILVGTGMGAERGLLIRGGDVLERVRQIDTIVFDKTGTLTTGTPIVTDCWLLSSPQTEQRLSADELLQIAATVESGTQHPLAAAILTAANQQGLALLPAENFHTQPGLGVSATVNHQQVIVGTANWLTQHGVDISAEPFPPLDGKTLVYVGIDGVLVGLIACMDIIRADAKKTVEALRAMGLQVMLLTGDRRAAAEAIAFPLGLEPTEIFADVRPDQKAALIQSLQNRELNPTETMRSPQCVIAMVGDGINDAPALAQADIGIALHSGTDVAIETADIVLMRDRLSDVVTSIQLSRATLQKIRQNLFWAFAYNTFGIPVAAGLLLPTFGFLLSPATAGAFMAFSSVSVVVNSLLLRRQFPRA